MGTDGLLTLRSSFGHQETVTRLETAIRANGMQLFARIDHQAAAAEAGVWLRATTLLIFGNARDWAPLMRARELLAIDLPFKALVWEGMTGETWLSYDDPRWLARRHKMPRELECVVIDAGIRISSIARKAVSPP
jgi:uncharacterized protein (DUF302 family)